MTIRSNNSPNSNYSIDSKLKYRYVFQFIWFTFLYLISLLWTLELILFRKNRFAGSFFYNVILFRLKTTQYQNFAHVVTNNDNTLSSIGVIVPINKNHNIVKVERNPQYAYGPWQLTCYNKILDHWYESYGS